ncbi:MAG: multidrug effflux MFS transporter [Tepidisphaeraceae bacterium]
MAWRSSESPRSVARWSIPSAPLIGLRMLQALGGCAEMVIARAIVRDKFAPRDAVRVFSGLVLVMGVAPILAPLTGGWLVGHHGWRAIFWALAASAIAIFLVIAFFFRESLPPERRVKDSPAGIARVYGALLRDVPFMAFAAVTGLVSAALFVYVGGSPLVFMKIYGISETHFGWFFGANAAGLIGMSQVNGALVHRGYSPGKLLKIALVVSTLSASAMLAVAVTGVGGFWALYATIFTCLACCGFIFPNATALAMAPHGKRAGGASAMLGFVQFLLSGIGGFSVSEIGATTPKPMAALMFAFTAAALLVSLLASRRVAGSIDAPGTPDFAH